MTDTLMHPDAGGFTHEPSAEDVVLLLHGWTGTPAQVRPLGERLSEAGYGVVAPLLPGHGTTISDLQSTGWRDWVEGATEAALGIVDRGQRLHVAGLSMGGVISVLLAATFEVGSLTTINAPYSVYSRTLRYSWFVRGSDRIRIEADPEYPDGYLADHHLGYRDTPVGVAAELFDLIRAMRVALPKVTAPTLVIQSRTDLTVKPESGRQIYEKLTTSYKQLTWLDNSAHVATLDNERERIAVDVIAHLAAADVLAG